MCVVALLIVSRQVACLSCRFSRISTAITFGGGVDGIGFDTRGLTEEGALLIHALPYQRVVRVADQPVFRH